MVRGGPAIAIVASLSIAVELELTHKFDTRRMIRQFIQISLDYLKTSQPTPPNLFEAAYKVWYAVELRVETIKNSKGLINAYLEAAENMFVTNIKNNISIGDFGAQWLLDYHRKDNLCILTFCNTGSLGTAGYGTAMGVIRSLHKLGKLEHVYCAETRPYEQGPHLTAYELEYENISANFICDSMVAALLSKGLVDGIVVGAEKVARNGDTTNKIGTLQLAKLANEFEVPFIVAAPTNSIEFNTFKSQETSIEECSQNEVTSSSLVSSGSDIVTVTVAHPEFAVWSPEFDVTPSSLVTAIVTERGAFVKEPFKEEYDPQTLLAE